MVRKNRGFPAEQNAVSDSLGDALLFATMYIVGLPVDVHVKDGSVFSGIFHTACVEDDYAVVLKRARMTKKGKCKVNVSYEDIIETLIVTGEDLVQVIAKGVLKADGVSGKVSEDDIGAAAGTLPSLECTEEKENAKFSKLNVDKKHASQTRQVGDGKLQVNQGDHEDTVHGVYISGSNLDTINTHLNGVNMKTQSKVQPVDVSSESAVPRIGELDAKSSRVSKDGVPVTNVSSESSPTSSSTSNIVLPPQSASSNGTSKEFKLNPGAKTFSPSFPHHRSATTPAVPTIATMSYTPNNSAVIPMTTTSVPAEAEVDSFAPPSLPVKFVPYPNILARNGATNIHYSQPIVAQVGNRAQPIRYATQYYPVQTGSAYVHPNSQNVMVGRLGPLVYMHPVSHDVIPLSQFPARPLLAQHQLHLSKHQGSAAQALQQMCVAPPSFIPTTTAGAGQAYTVSSHMNVMPISQPGFPLIHHPIPLPGPNSLLPSKFS